MIIFSCFFFWYITFSNIPKGKQKIIHKGLLLPMWCFDRLIDKKDFMITQIMKTAALPL